MRSVAAFLCFVLFLPPLGLVIARQTPSPSPLAHQFKSVSLNRRRKSVPAIFRKSNASIEHGIRRRAWILLRGGSSSSWSSGNAPPVRTAPRQVGNQPSRSTTRRYPTVEDIDDGKARSAETKQVIDAFLTRDSRKTFIARVYAILAGQLLVTGLSVVGFGLNPSISSWMIGRGRAVPLLSLALSTVAWFVMCGSERARREAPMKWQLLVLFTLGEAISVGFISSLYKFRSVLSALMATTVATFAISMYTMLQKNPKYDLSQWGAGLSSVGMIFLVYGLIRLLELIGILPRGFLPYSDAAYSLIGASLFSFYLAYHTRLIVSGKHSKFQMNEKDYVFGAMALYQDIINMFIYILRLLGEDREN